MILLKNRILLPVLMALLILSPTVSMAESAELASETGVPGFWALLFSKGGVVTWVIALLSAVGLPIAAIKLYEFYRMDIFRPQGFEAALDDMRRGKTAGLVTRLDALAHPAAPLIAFALSQSGASSTAARWLANKENQADLVGGLNVQSKDRHVQRALLDMSTTAQINDSLALGTVLLGEIGNIGRLHKPRVEQAGFAVLKAPDIPSVLVETAFISNPEEEARLRSSAYQQQLADALMRGITRYFAKNPPLARSRSV